MSEQPSPSPLRLTGTLDEPLSRWLWLVKWLLLIPHYIVLAVLWVAVLVVTVIAFFAVLVTGRYPSALFGFTRGVLRWSWRVGFYGYGGLATDRYPPFTLADVPDYPARLELDEPEDLSRGLVLVKWWLLALPHYLLLGAAAGAVTVASDRSDTTASLSVVTLAVLFAGIALLIRGHYPRGLFDLAVGLHRWAYRVAVYSLLLTDSYPPFRLDQGGDDPGPMAAAAPPPVTGPGVVPA